MPSSYRRAGLVRRALLSQGCGFSCRGNFSGLAAESLSFLEGQALWQEGDRNGAVLAPACPLLLSVPSLPNLPARLGGLSRTDVPPESAAGAPGSGLMSAPSFPPSLLPALQRAVGCLGLVLPTLPFAQNHPLPWLLQLRLWQVQPESWGRGAVPALDVGPRRAREAAAALYLNGSRSLCWWGVLWLWGNCWESQLGLGLRFYFSEAAECGGWWESGSLFFGYGRKDDPGGYIFPVGLSD